MAPKKTKTSDSINSRLALVMKSGKGVSNPPTGANFDFSKQQQY
jgi:hypothetical protein